MKTNILMLLAVLGAAVPVRSAGLPLNLTGTTTLSLGDRIVDDRYEDQTLIDGVYVPLRLVLMGRKDAFDFNFVANVYYNEWSNAYADLVALNLKHRNFGAVLGDSYVRQRSLTVMNRKMRGVNGYYDMLKVNNDVLLKLELVGGISGFAQEDGEKLAHQVYRRSASGDEYRQYLGALALRMKPVAAMDADLTILYATHDEGSVDAPIGAEPEASDNLLVSIGSGYTFWQEQMFAQLEYGHSSTETRNGIDAGTRTGDAVKMSLDGRTGPVRFRGKFDYIDPGFQTEGNPYLETDRMGGYGQVGYVAKGLFTAGASFETYVRNLGNDTSATVFDTRTNEVEGQLGTAWKWNPNLNFSYRLKDELSTGKNDGTIVDRTSHTVSGGMDFSFKKIRASFGVSQKMILDDSQLYIAAADTQGIDLTINDVTGQLSVSSSVRWRPNSTWNVIGGINNILGSTEGRDGSDNATSINYVYLSVNSSFSGGKYRPSLDLIYNDYADDSDPTQNYGLSKAKLALDYRVARTQSTKVFYEFEMSTVTDAGDLDYTANGFGLEYTLLF